MNTADTQGVGVDRLFETGAHFAQVKSRRHPSMKKFVLGTKSKVEIFDLTKTDSQIATAKAAMSALGKEGKTVLFIGGKREVSDQVAEAASRNRVGRVDPCGEFRLLVTGQFRKPQRNRGTDLDRVAALALADEVLHGELAP